MSFSWFPVVCPFTITPRAQLVSGLEAVQACAKKTIFQVFFKLLGKTMFQVPKSTHILILRGLESSPKHAQNQIGAWKIVFPQSLSFFKLLGKTMFQVPKSTVYPHIDFAWIGSSPSMCEKNNRSLKNCFSANPDFIPQYPKGSRHQKERIAKGNCKPHV